jgi:methionyl-tRNA formyltransferase
MQREPLRLVFAGTPAFALPSFAACRGAPGVRLVGVYTQPERPAGRGRALAVSPIKQAALAAGVPVLQPESLKSRDVQAQLAALAPDLLIVVAYGLILPRAALALPRHGCWNVHASLLPRWRGAAPIQRALLAGDAQTGVCLMQMQAGLDTGPVLLTRRTPIIAADTGGSLHDRLAALGGEMLGIGLARLGAGTLPVAQAQAESGVSYAHKLAKAEAMLDFSKPAPELERQVRAFDPWPVAEAEIAGERVRVWRAQALPADVSGAAPGGILDATRAGIDLATGAGVLRVLELQRAGARRISAADYLNARPELRARG